MIAKETDKVAIYARVSSSRQKEYLNTINTKGALAIESMADESSLYTREVFAVNLAGNKCRLLIVSNTSKKHADCGGKLIRSTYDMHLVIGAKK